MLLRELDSFWKRTLTVAALACALALPACGDDAGTDTGGEPSTGDDDADDDVTDDDTDDDVTDDDTDPPDDDADDDAPPRGNLDGGTRMDGGRTDARVADGSTSDGATSDAGDASTAGDGSSPAVDAGGLDATVARDASTDARVVDASSDARVDARTPDERPDRGRGNGRDVVLIGDSWMDNVLLGTGGGIAPALISATGQRYRNYARQGTLLLEDSLAFGDAIPTQFEAAVRADRAIQTVVMSAGGNDVIQNGLQDDCASGGQRCAMKLQEIGRGLKALWDRMAAAGVQDIIHVMYASTAGAGIEDEEENDRALAELCAAVAPPTRCHLFETDEYVRTDADLADSIHPDTAANQRIARALAEFMEEEGIRR